MSQDYRELLGPDLLSDSRTYINETNDALRTDFAGAIEPSSPAAYQTWKDTTTQTIKQRNAANDAWIVVALLGTAYGGLLPLAGGTMSGALNMGGQQVTNVGLGTGTAAARQQEVDLKAPLAAPSFTGDATINQDPAGVNSIIRRSWAEGRYAKLSGAAMTGPLTLGGYAAGATEAVPKSSIQDMVTFNTTTGHHHDGINSRRVRGVQLNSADAGAVDDKLLVSTADGVATWKFLTDLGYPGRLIRGGVAADGSIAVGGGGGWSCSKVGVGQYKVSFSPTLSSWPVVIIGRGTGTAFHTYHLDQRYSTHFQIQTYSSTGYADRSFDFVAIANS